MAINPCQHHSIAVWAVVPAAGMSRRMGRPKQTLPFRGTTMLAGAVQTLLDSEVDGVVCVTRSEFRDQLALFPRSRVHVAINDQAASEMVDSIREGLAALARGACGDRMPAPWDAVLILPCDMPHVSESDCKLCMGAYRREPSTIVVAAHQERRGHPIIFPFSLCAEVGRLVGGLRTLLDVHSDIVRPVETGSTGVLHDVDFPEDVDQVQWIRPQGGLRTKQNPVG